MAIITPVIGSLALPPRLLSLLSLSLLFLLLLLQQVPLRLDDPLFHEMTHDVQPLPIPAQHPRPDIVPLVRLDFPPETAMHAPEHDDYEFPRLFFAFAGRAHLLLHSSHARRAERGYEVRPGNVEVAEVGAVGFVEVVVAFEEGRAGGCY